MDETLYFPITIECSRRSIKISDSIYLKRIDLKKCKKLLGIKNLVLSENGLIKEIEYDEDASWFRYIKIFPLADPNISLMVKLTNFLLVVKNTQQATNIAFAMKLLMDTKSGPYMYFCGLSPKAKTAPSLIEMFQNRFNVNLFFSNGRILHCPYWGDNVLKLDNVHIEKLRKIVSMIDGNKDKKLQTIIEKFLYAESYGPLSKHLRYLELAVILEMLFLPNKAQELRYRFRLRVAKWFHTHYKENLNNKNNEAVKIYDLRSKIAHSGTARISDVDLNTIRRTTRKAINKYIFDNTIFTDKYLDNLCLGI